MLPNVLFVPNLKYNFNDNDKNLKCAKALDGVYELDILGISNKATYVIEVKAGLLGEDSKRGAVKSIKSDLSKIVGDAVCQSYRAYKYIQKEDNCIFYTANKKQIFSPIRRDIIFRISVSFSYVGGAISSLIKLKEFGVIDINSEYAWTVNIFDLIPLTEIIISEEEFIDFLEKRIISYSDRRLDDVDEMDMLGLYLENDMKIDSAFEKSDFVVLNGYKDILDNYFEGSGEKPKKKAQENSGL